MATSNSSSVIAEDFEDLYQGYTKGIGQTKNDDGTIYKTRFEDITQLYNHYGGLGDVFRTSEQQSRDNESGRSSDRKFGDVALLLRRTYHEDKSPRGGYWTLALEIQSPILRQSFKEIVKGCTTISLEKNPIVLNEPFAELYFCHEKIEEAIKETKSEEAKSALQLLENFRQAYMKHTIAGLETTLSEGLIEASNLWCLFPVGSTIVLENRTESQKPLTWCVIVRGCVKRNSEEVKSQKNVWSVSVEFTSFNGVRFSPTERSFHIGGFEGPRSVRSLPAYPLNLHPQKDRLRQSLIERGRKYVSLAIGKRKTTSPCGKGSHRTYRGPFWTLDHLELWRREGVDFHSRPQRHHDGRIVVDPAGLLGENAGFRDTIQEDIDSRFDRYHMYSSTILTKTPLTEVDETDDEPSLQDDDYLTIPATIPAYSLSFKKWGLVDVEHVNTITWQEDIYDMLQMETGQKTMVRNIIDCHHASSVTFDDFIPGKGRGLVFLLHGPPGCGKTLTAESAAESLHRPLYYISGAELGMLRESQGFYGSGSISIEDKLELIFKRIARWEAIMLFDEAESFVASRKSESNSAQKNALTSILLRILEYQSGIIFLTTNRVSDFDSALFSRVHITLKFEALTSSHSRFIWKKMAAQTHHDLSEDDFDKLSQIPIDGRTIKNVLRVASLQTKNRENKNNGVPARLNMADVKVMFPYAAGASESSEIQEKMKALYVN